MPHLIDLVETYDPQDDVNIAGYAGSLAVYAATVAGLASLGRAKGHELPEHWSAHDLAIGGIATHKVTRLLSRASVTSPVRAPFTQFEAAAGSGEHVERARPGHGVRHTIGELLTCPFCLGVWVGTSYVAGLAVAPRSTRAVAAVFAVVAVSDTLQHAYSRLRGD